MSVGNLENSELRDRILRCLGPLGSISNSIHTTSPDDLPVKLYRTQLTANNHGHLHGSRLSSSAAKTDRDLSIIAAAGEALERYALGIPKHPPGRKSPTAVNRSSALALDLSELQRLQGLCAFQFSSPACRLSPILEETSFEWIEASRLLDGSDVLVPQELVQLRRKSKPYFEVTTNGCALSTTEERATLSASYELIERHNMMLLWWAKKEPIYIDFKDALREFNPTLHNAFGPWLRYIHVIYYPGPLNVPTFISFFSSRNDRRHPAFFISAAANLNPQAAIESTLQELGTILNTKMRRHFSETIAKDRFSYDLDREFVDFKDHHEFYMFDRNVPFLHFLKNMGRPDRVVPFSEIANQASDSDLGNLEILRKKFQSEGHNPIVINQTTRDIHELGLQVVRLIDADIIDLNAAHAHRRWGKRTLYDETRPTPDRLHQWPHPFP